MANSSLAQKQLKASTPIQRFIFSIVVSVLIACILALIYGYNPGRMFLNLAKGAWVGKLNFGTTLEKFTTILLLGTAFNICVKVDFFNLGLEGSLYLGALTYAVIGYQFPNLPGIIYVPICIICTLIVGAIWGAIPAFLKTKWNVNEVCVTLLLNYAVTLFCTYAIYYIWAAKTSIPQTPPLVEQVLFAKILLPSRAHVGLFLSIAIYIATLFFTYRTASGHRMLAIGQNQHFAHYIGIRHKRNIVLVVMVGGAMAGLAGGMEIGGMYGRFVDEFAMGATFNGLLASRLVSNNMFLLPISSFVLASLLAGAYGVERAVGIPRNFIDCFIYIMIMMITMDGFYDAVRGVVFKAFGAFSKNKVKEGSAT